LRHKKIAYLRGPMFWRAAKLRYAGWLKELKGAGLQPGPVVDGDWSAESGFEAIRKLLATNWREFTAVVVANDQMALGAIRALEESGIRIPQDISIAGFDDIPEAGFFRPPLSTIKQDFAALGQLSVQCLIAQFPPSRANPRARTIQPIFIERQSTALPPTVARLVHRVISRRHTAVGQLPDFQGANDEHPAPFCSPADLGAPVAGTKMERDVRSEQRRKSANWPRPKGLA
jgi:hypothetical protein